MKHHQKRISGFQIVGAVLYFFATPAHAQIDFWEQTNPSLDDTIFALTINSAGDIFAGTYSGKVYCSTNTGTTWNRSDSGLTASVIHSFAVSPNGDLYAGTGFSGVFRSTDNGGSWIQVNAGLSNAYVMPLLISSSGDIFAGSGSGIFRSSDKGGSWTEKDTGLYDGLIECLSVNLQGHIYVGTFYGGGIFASTDNGDHWNHVGLAQKYPRAIVINQSDAIFVTAGYNGIFHSTDNGATWANNDSAFSGSHVAPAALNSFEHVFVGTYDRGVFRSSDNGESWREVNSGLLTMRIYSLAVNQQGVIFAGTDHGVFRSVQSTTSIKGIPDELPASFSLEQNYPNPFNPTTVIRYKVKSSAHIDLKVFDVLGRELITLVDEVQQAGSKAVTLDAANLPSGVYFYRMQVGPFANTKKLNLLR